MILNQVERNKIESFLRNKVNNFFKKKKPKSDNYPFKLVDPYIEYDESLGLENFYLVGKNWIERKEKPIAIMIGFNDWKFGFVSDYLPEYRTAFLPRKIKNISFFMRMLKLKEKPSCIYIWGFNASSFIEKFALLKKIPIIRVEDGFVRSSSMGATHSTPYSLVFDNDGLYYNAQNQSQLEKILNTYDFTKDKELIKKANNCIRLINDLKISKYTLPDTSTEKSLNKIKTKKRVAILGQVDNDAAIRFGNPDGWSTEELIKLARFENPESDIFYRPHPEIFKGFQKSKFKKKRVEYFAEIVSPEEPLLDFLDTIDHVYTITSLSGLEALIRGIKVTTVGIPFYSGWGLTDDRVKVDRRTARLTISELFAGAYLLYPKYLADLSDSYAGLRSTCYRITIDKEILAHNHFQKSYSSSGELPSINNVYWPKLINNPALAEKNFTSLIKDVDFSKHFRQNSNDALYQTILLFLLVGSLKNNDLKNIFLEKTKELISTPLLNELLVHLDKYAPGSYISKHISYLLSRNEEHDFAIDFLNQQILNNISKDNISEIDSSAEIYNLPKENLDFYSEILTNQIECRDLDSALDNIKLLLINNHNIKQVIKHALFLAELRADYISVYKISKLWQVINIYDSNRLAVMSELRSSLFYDLDNSDDYMLIATRAITLKPEKISNVLTYVDSLPEIFESKDASKLLTSMLNLDNEVSRRKAQAYLALEQAEKAEHIVRELIESGDDSEMTRILYSQSLSFNNKIDQANKVMELSRKIKISTESIQESLRLCTLTSDYKFSLELIDIANKNGVQIGEMYRRKAYFGNRMIQEAFQTFTEFHQAKVIKKYYPKKYLDINDIIETNQKLFLISIFGPGDEIRFASIYNKIQKELKTNHISISCSPRLYDLFSKSFPSIEFIPVHRPRNSDRIQLEDYGLVPGSDLFGVINNNAALKIDNVDKIALVTDLLHQHLYSYDCFQGERYLFAEEKLSQTIREKLPKDSILVGISWRSSITTHSRNEHYLSVENLEPLFKIPGVQFVNLQYDECAEELQWIEERYPGKVINFAEIDQYNDFDSVAALMTCMDLIISPATTVVELAGALGCRTWLFSNSSEIDWRKKNDDGIDVWHNNTTIIEGDVIGDKDSLVKNICLNLEHFLKKNRTLDKKNATKEDEKISKDMLVDTL